MMDSTGDVADAGPTDTDAPKVVRRNRPTPFNAPASERAVDVGITVGRNWSTISGPRKPSGLTRNRVVAGDLPDWTPLPPGELRVDRSV